MPNKNKTLPLGKLLQNAGLISDEQLALALQVQSEYTKMRLGEILTMQEIIEPQTVNFFADKWQNLEPEGKQFPLGYYLKQAYLLNEEQIQVILTEQKKSNLKFGEIAVSKGWLKQGTLDFFLHALSSQTTKFISLIELEEYNQTTLHLEQKYFNYSLILSRILAWTGGDSKLTKAICHIFASSDFNIPAGKEINAVDKLVENYLIRNWQTSQIGAYIRSIQANIIDNPRCDPALLIAEYQNILLLETIKYTQLPEQDELINLGIIINDNNHLKITNLIIQQIFNQDWIVKTQKKLASKIKQSSAVLSDAKQANSSDLLEETEGITRTEIILTNRDKTHLAIEKVYHPQTKKTEVLTKFSSVFTLAMIIVLIPFILVINNYYSAKQESEVELDNQIAVSDLAKSCNEINLVNPVSVTELISQLENRKKEILRSFPHTLERFPDNCETALNRLRVLAAPQLGKENRVIEALRNLCKIPSTAEHLDEAKIWLEHWHNSNDWQEETKSYLRLVKECPAGEY